jgi:F-type H+-transporting ATPase subunit c
MSKLSMVVGVLAVLFFAAPLFGQGDRDRDRDRNAPTPFNWAIPLGAGLGMGIASGLAGIGQGKVAAAVAEALARNPGARPGIQLALFIGLAFIESLVLFAFVMIYLRTS